MTESQRGSNGAGKSRRERVGVGFKRSRVSSWWVSREEGERKGFKRDGGVLEGKMEVVISDSEKKKGEEWWMIWDLL